MLVISELPYGPLAKGKACVNKEMLACRELAFMVVTIRSFCTHVRISEAACQGAREVKRTLLFLGMHGGSCTSFANHSCRLPICLAPH
jgi:hypothetical protein